MDLLSATTKVTSALKGLNKTEALKVLSFTVECVSAGPDIVGPPPRAPASSKQPEESAAPS